VVLGKLLIPRPLVKKCKQMLKQVSILMLKPNARPAKLSARLRPMKSPAQNIALPNNRSSLTRLILPH
jgi:hypothetical protein